MWEKVLLILALHGSATFDAWSTNRFINDTPPGWPARERNPIYRPWAGGKGMYVAVNLTAIPADIAILRVKKRRQLARALILGQTASHAFCGAQNTLHHNARIRLYQSGQRVGFNGLEFSSIVLQDSPRTPRDALQTPGGSLEVAK